MTVVSEMLGVVVDSFGVDAEDAEADVEPMVGCGVLAAVDEAVEGAAGGFVGFAEVGSAAVVVDVVVFVGVAGIAVEVGSGDVEDDMIPFSNKGF